MSVYDELQYLYSFDENKIIEVMPIKSTYTISGEQLYGYTVAHKGSEYFIHRLKRVDETNRTMGNLWSVYSIDDSRVVRSGCKTKKQAIEEIKYI